MGWTSHDVSSVGIISQQPVFSTPPPKLVFFKHHPAIWKLNSQISYVPRTLSLCFGRQSPTLRDIMHPSYMPNALVTLQDKQRVFLAHIHCMTAHGIGIDVDSRLHEKLLHRRRHGPAGAKHV